MLTALIAILLVPFAVLTAFFAVEVLAGLRPLRGRGAGAHPPSAVVVMPAHDEAAVIGNTLRSLNTALGEGMRVLVVADNCGDSTAAEARQAGAEVLERQDSERHGKGFALAFAADHLAADPPKVFVVLDADCAIDRSSLRALVDEAARSGRPCQSINLLRADRKASPLVQLSTFAFMLKNLVRQRGLQRLAGRVHLTGTGMAMPFALFRASGQVHSSIVEDLALGLELAEAGHPSKLVPDAFVWSSGSSEEGTLTQRRRWEGGFIATALRQGPKLIRHAITRGDFRALFAGLDLLVPPLALFAILNLAALLLAAVLTLALGARVWPVLTHFALLGVAGLALFLAWLSEGRTFVSLSALARLPLYVLWKLPLYLGLARRGAPDEWLRTGR
jgi:cellulose synthase/poly-beta-1,6-N-acetylglucosamine synthase-like glycosyltransferase